MHFEFKMFFIKFATLIILAPLGGYALLRYAEYAEKVWKTNHRIKKWVALCFLFMFLMVIGGFLQ